MAGKGAPNSFVLCARRVSAVRDQVALPHFARFELEARRCRKPSRTSRAASRCKRRDSLPPTLNDWAALAILVFAGTPRHPSIQTLRSVEFRFVSRFTELSVRCGALVFAEDASTALVWRLLCFCCNLRVLSAAVP